MAPPAADARLTLLRRVLFALGLFGVLLVAHLYFQREADFAYGCTGAAELTAAEAADQGCAQVTNSIYSSFLGVSNLVWGLLFYLTVAGLRLAYAMTGNERWRLASFAVVGVGFLYTLYLVYLQVAEIGAFCVLCMTSAATVTLLLILHVMEHLRSRPEAVPPAEPSKKRGPVARPSLRPYAIIGGVFAALLIVDAAAFARRGDDAPTDTADADTTATPATPPGVPLRAGSQCTFDPVIPPIADLDRWTGEDWPHRGEAGAPVRVVEFFDPNCPHCKHLGETLEPVIAENGSRARFFLVPFALRENSLGQVFSLYMAREEGKYFELVEAMFERQDANWGMSVDEIVASAHDAGMNASAVRARLTALEGQLQAGDSTQIDPLFRRMMDDRGAIAEAIDGPEGGVSVPKLAVDGRVVEATVESYGAACLNEFIEAAHQAHQGGAR